MYVRCQGEKNKGQLDKGGEQKVIGIYLRSKPKKMGFRKRMHEIWKQEGMKETGRGETLVRVT